MSENARKPSIQFAGFDDAWEQRKLGEIADIVRGASPRPIKDPKWFDDKSDIGWLRISDVTQQDGRIHYLEQRISEMGQERTRVLIEPHLLLSIAATVGKPVINYIKTGVHDGFLIFQNPRFDCEFLFQWLEMFRPKWQKFGQPGSQVNLNSDLVKNMQIMLPVKDEQRTIGAFFSNLDNLITLHQRKYEKLVSVKKSMLEKLFPKNGSNIPEIRFAGFTDPWEQRKFGTIVVPYSDPIETPKDGYIRLGIRSHAKGTFHNYVKPGMQLETAQMHRVGAGNFIVNITFGWEHAVAITDQNDDGKLVSHRFPQFKFIDGMQPGYFKLLILDERFRHHLWLSSPGGAGRNRVLNIKEMLEYPFWVTSEFEQKKIADFFIKLDNLITLHQRKLEKLKKVKKAMLDKMFV
ncbi:restriction endonuclease subunit S [Pleomorphochaeta sp. DL1XJH-081]|uniref:restriction endonuclease subunit S n=1 Tax=Pleomorphochaeta sp. DL1XJH-081 TaxID=3409690 RepID=UPI003BB4D5A2